MVLNAFGKFATKLPDILAREQVIELVYFALVVDKLLQQLVLIGLVM